MKTSSVCASMVIVASLALIAYSRAIEQVSATSHHVTVSHRLPDWSAADGHRTSALNERIRRGVQLSTLRRLMNNIALSEYYRLRGLEVLGKLNSKATMEADASTPAPSKATMEADASTPAPSITSETIISPVASQVIAVTSVPPSSTSEQKGHTQAEADEKVFQKYNSLFGIPENQNGVNTNSRYMQAHQII